jgi:acetyltransferase-like isoleucine patch superfamily enzyme
MNIKMILGLPKTLYFNFYYLPFWKAVRLPIRVAPNVKIKSMGQRTSVKIRDGTRIHIGTVGSFGLGNKQSTYWQIGKDASVIFSGNAIFGKGTQIIANGALEFGKDFFCNANCIINSGSNISFGSNCILGWNVTVMDGDGHRIFKRGENPIIESPDIHVGNHVWIASEAMLLKGASVQDHSVVAAKGCITQKFKKDSLLVGGFNRILSENICWEK